MQTSRDSNAMRKASSADCLPTPLSYPSNVTTTDPTMTYLSRRSQSGVSDTPSSSSTNSTVVAIRNTMKTSTKTKATIRKRVIKKKPNAVAPQILMESFRDFLEDLPNEQLRRRRSSLLQPFQEDKLGAAITAILNANPEFQYDPSRHAITCNHDDNADDSNQHHTMEFRPLLSLQNWKRLLAVLSYLRYVQLHSDVWTNLPYTLYGMFRFVFWNVKTSFSGFVLCFVGWSMVFLGTTSASVAIVTLWTWKWCSVVTMLFLSVLVDWNDAKYILPQPFVQLLHSLSDFITWIDEIALNGKRFRGREWNQDDFELERPANQAQSSRPMQYLWNLPPPSIHHLGHEHCTEPKYLQRSEWSIDTTEHVAAINYCYLLLRQDFEHSQCNKQQQNASSRKSIATSPSSNDAMLTLNEECTEFNTAVKKRKGGKEEGSSTRRLRRLSSVDAIPTDFDIDLENDDGDIRRSRSTTLDKELSLRLQDILESDDDDNDSLLGDRSTIISLQESLRSGSDATVDMNWMDVGAEIGIKLLGSAAVQKAMTSHDTAEKINEFKDRVESRLAATKQLIEAEEAFQDSVRECHASTSGNHGDGRNIRRRWDVPDRSISIPVHSMWTSASAAITSAGSLDAQDDPKDLYSELSSQRNPYDDMKENCSSRLLLQDVSDSYVPFDKTENAFLLSKRPNTICKQEERKSSGSKQGIEMICTGTDSKQILIQPGTPNLPAVYRRPLLLPGVKIVVPLFPVQPGSLTTFQQASKQSIFQMGTVVLSKRLCIYPKNGMPQSGQRTTNCLSITVKLDKCFLRNGEFATLTLRVMDHWSPRFMPLHSKLPLGSCVSTTFGIGVLVGWRVEDDCHIVRCLWQRRGPGSAYAYLQRSAIHSTMEAAIGFTVETTLGRGTVVAYTNGGPDFRCGRYFVFISEHGRLYRQVIELNRADILSCEGAKFIPIVEHIREAAQYQLQVDFYEEYLKEDDEELDSPDEFDGNKILAKFSKHFSTIWKSFLRAIDEDDEFDDGMNAFIQSCINFLNKLDEPDAPAASPKRSLDASVVICATESSSHASHKSFSSSKVVNERSAKDFWLMDNLFGFFRGDDKTSNDAKKNEAYNGSECIEVECTPAPRLSFDKTYQKGFAVIRTLMRTISIAQAASADDPDFKLGLSICYEFLLFVKTVVKVQRKNMNPESLTIWRRAWHEIVSVFGPVKERLTKIGEGIAERMEKHGRRAKARLLRFVDIVVQDESLLMAIEHGDWSHCSDRIEVALVRARIIEESSRAHYHKTALFLYKHFAHVTSQNKGAAARNNEKMEKFLMAVQMLAAPRKAILKLFLDDHFLDILERILVRVFSKHASASQMLTIHSSNFHSLRQLRMLKDFTIAGKFWIPLLDAADEEFAWTVSKLPEHAQAFLSPLSSLFSLCVVQFHKINDGDLTKDWLDFLLEDEAVEIIHDIDMKLILALESFSRDIKEAILVLPYYSSIDVDILNLVDELNIDEFVKEASVALEDEARLRIFVREKSTAAIERFLDYIPKMSIPVEKRDLQDGWTVTCRGSDGGHLKLKDLVIKRENLTCQVLGGDTIFFPMLTAVDNEDTVSAATSSIVAHVRPQSLHVVTEEKSILDDIRDIIVNAQRFGCWRAGVGGVNPPPTNKYSTGALRGLPISSVLDCAIDLWRNLEIDDDELLEIAIRDVSYQIRLQKQREDQGDFTSNETKEDQSMLDSQSKFNHYQNAAPSLRDIPEPRTRRFNPRNDPTVLFLQIKNLSFNLEDFHFRIEKNVNKRTIFDPVFEGTGNLLVRNVSVQLRVECLKDYVIKHGQDAAVPLLQISALDVSIEKVHLRVQDTGADWLLNKIVDGFGEKLTEIMSTNLCNQIRMQIDEGLMSLNSYFESNPDVFLGLLDISMDDLDERVIWV